MKKIFPFVLLLFITPAVFSQTIFMGKVTHQFKSDKENESGTVEVFYGDQKIKGIKKTRGKENQARTDDILIDFSKGTIYHINALKKTYKADTLTNKSVNMLGGQLYPTKKNKMVLNYSCSAFALSDTGKFGTGMDFLFWYADSLYYPVNEKYLHADEVLLFTNGKTIGMGVAIGSELYGEKIVIGMNPLAVEAISLPDSLFEIPKDYVLEKYEQYIQADSTVLASDSVARMLDSAVKAVKTPKKPVKKAVPQSGKKKLPVNPKAIGRKDTN
jgi:hypothetical protein